MVVAQLFCKLFHVEQFGPLNREHVQQMDLMDIVCYLELEVAENLFQLCIGRGIWDIPLDIPDTGTGRPIVLLRFRREPLARSRPCSHFFKELQAGKR
jgi:hypothetical protein